MFYKDSVRVAIKITSEQFNIVKQFSWIVNFIWNNFYNFKSTMIEFMMLAQLLNILRSTNMFNYY